MEKNRSKVLMSILIVALCLSVCIGLTYAYFTDTASSKGNKIQAGSLKLDLQLYDQIGGWHSIKDSQDPVFNYDKWEPGYVDAKLLRVVNLGNLALKWEAKLVSTEAVSQYANVIEVYVQTSSSEMPYPASRAEALAWTHVGSLDDFINTTQQIANGIFTAQGESAYISIALYMPAEIEDNNLQGQVLGEFDIQINATQYTYEEDAIGSDYDTSARFPEGGVTPPDDTEDTTEPTETEPDETTTPGEPTDEPVEPTDPELFTWAPSADGNSYTVTGLKNPGTVEDVVIPATYNGLPVTAIGYAAFFDDDVITSITIPDSVTTIGDSAFNNCNGLTGELIIPDSVTTIDVLAFYDCDGLTSVTIGNGVTSIGENAFLGCNSLVYNEYDNGCYLGNDSNKYIALVKAKDTTIESCIINEATKIICAYAFEGCYSLTNIVIPDSVLAIGCAAFLHCNLPAIYCQAESAPDGWDPDWNAADLNSVEYILYFPIIFGRTGPEDSIFTFKPTNDGSFYTVTGLVNPGTVTDLVIPSTYNGLPVTAIGDWAFDWDSTIESVTIPDSVTVIGNYAFYGCSGLTSVTIGNGVTTIGESAFSGCSGLTSIEIPDSVTVIGNSAFYGCSGLTSITIGNGVTTIGENAFYGCSGLTAATIPSSVVSIGINPFIGCTQLTNIAVADENTAYKSIDGNLYSKDGTVLVTYAIGKSDTNFTIPDSVTTIGNSAFSGCSGLTSIEIPDSVTVIGNSAFYGCSGLTSVTIGNGVTTIGMFAFSGCSGLTSIEIPNSVTTIGNYAFYNCPITEIEIPNSVTTIGEKAFYDCFNLTEVFIPDSVINMGSYAFSCAKVYCQAPEAPDGWSSCWYCGELCMGDDYGHDGNYDAVVWGYTGE